MTGPRHRSLRFRLGSSLGVNGVTLLAIVFQELILVPFFLYAWDAALYRDWLVVIAAVELVGVIDLGMNNYFSNAFMRARNQHDEAAYARLRALALGVYALILTAAACLVVLPVLALSAGLFDELFALEAGLGGDAAWIWLLMGVNLMTRLPGGPMAGIYRAEGDPALGHLVGLASVVSRVGVTVPVLLAGGGALELAGAIVCANSLLLLLIAGDLQRRYRLGLARPVLPDAGEWRDLAGKGAGFSLGNAATVGTVQGLVLMTAHFALNPLAVVVLTTTRTVTGMVRQIASQAAGVFAVEQSRELAGGNTAQVAGLMRSSLRLSCGAAGGLGGMVVILGVPLMSVWTMGKVDQEGVLVYLLIVSILISAPARSAAQLFYFTNRPHYEAVAQSGVLVLMLLFCAVLIPRWGVVGAGAALLIGESLAIALALGRVVARDQGISWWVLQWAGWRWIIPGFAVGAACALAATHVFAPTDWVTLIAAVSLWCALALIPAIRIMVPPHERKRAWTWLISQRRRI
ncbi:MAG: lipopolysaccharide biosynthesis protein [Gammaproteobacteria bacterium]